MIHFSGRGILLDIEGTTSTLAYVHEVLFPYARRELDGFLRKHWNSPEVARVREQMALDAGTARDGFAGWPDLSREVHRLMDMDAKQPALKALQGLIWEEGFRGGILRSQIFPDVPPALSRWERAGVDARIFSSGSVHAQQLYFGHTEAGDLRAFLSGYYDTTTGGKRVSSSYCAIAREMRLPPCAILFLSDVVAELDAAWEAGMHTALALRPGNPPAPLDSTHATFHSFDEIKLLPGADQNGPAPQTRKMCAK